MSVPTSTKRDRLWERFRNKVYRDAFVEAHVSTNIAAQIYSMREARGWTQRELADAADMTQERISIMEDPAYRRFTLSTLKRIASAFDVALIVRFAPFSELLEWATSVSHERLAVPSYDDDRARPRVFSTQVSSGSAASIRADVVALDKYRPPVSVAAAGDRNSQRHLVA